MANGLPINLDTFKRIESPEAKMDALFEVLVYLSTEKCEKRFSSIEKRNRIDTTISGLMGLVGGIAYNVGKRILGG